MKKRLISILLVAAMLVCMIPTFASAEVGESYCYNLARLQWGQWSSEGVHPSTLTDWDSLAALDEKGNYFNRTTDPFKFYGQSSTVAWSWTGSSHNEVGPTIDGLVGDWGGIVIRVGESAVYDVSMRLLDNAAAASLDFYLAPVDAANPQSTKYYLGSSNYTETAGTLKMTSFGEQYLEAGDYAVIFKMTKKGTAYTAISNVTLTWVTDEKPVENYCYNLASLQWGQWSSEGVNPSTLTDWDSLDELELTKGNYFNRTTDPFKFYGQSSTVAWSWTGSSHNEVGPTIDGSVGDWGGIVIRVGESAVYDVSMRLLDNAAAASLDFYLAPADAENPQSAEYYLGSSNYTETTGTLKMTSFGEQYLEAGDYVVIFKMTKKGSAYTAISNVTLTWVTDEKPVAPPKNYVYNLMRLQWGQWSEQGVAPSTLTDWNSLAELDSKGNYYNYITDPYKYFGESSAIWTWTKSSMNIGPQIWGGAGQWAGLILRVDQAAQYHLTAKMRDNASATQADFYFAPYDANKEAADYMVSDNFVGHPTFTGDGVAAVDVSFGEHYLEAGDYVLLFKITDKGSVVAGIKEIGLDWISYDDDCVLATQNGAAIRVRAPQGQRFKSSISKEFLDGADVVEYGTILMPTEDLQGDIAGNLVVGYSYGGHTAATVPANIIHSEDENNVYFTAVLIEIPAKYYSRSITARAYAKLSDGTYIYGDTDSSRSILEVAQNGKASGTASAAEIAVFDQIIADAEAANV